MVDQPVGFPTPLPRKRPESVDPYWTESPWASRRWRRVLLGAVGVALVLAVVTTIIVVRARDNYLAGTRALAAGQYDIAIRRLSAADMVGRPYADARTLLAEAETLANGQAQYLSSLQRRLPPNAATLTLRRAATLFQSGHYAAAEKLVADVEVRVPPAVAARLQTASNAAVAALLLLNGAEQALAAGDTTAASRGAAAVLERFPACAPAKALSAEAARRVRAAPFAQRAATLAAARHWSLARAAARTTLRIDPTYPGMAFLLARINAAITKRNAAKAKAAAAAAATAAAAAAAANTATVTPAPVKSVAPQPPPP